ncbi:hypothetical protein [Parafrankia sp. FMc2]|uniref:hypothetical protein n=1 Tax=Parafrankia sp. FMc2 TaxID=3233196 RepID=UPI0034D7A45B
MWAVPGQGQHQIQELFSGGSLDQAAPGEIASDDRWSEAFPVEGCEQAAELLADRGLTEESGGGWYQQSDVSTAVDYATGERRQTTGHLHGFSPKHERRVGELLARRVRGEQ